jgi:hypothetical protein
MKKRGTRGIAPDSQQHRFYQKVVAELKKRGLME